MVSEADARGRVERQVLPVLRLQLQERLEFFAGPKVLLPVKEDAGILEPGGSVVRGEFQDGREQNLRIVQYLTCNADTGEQSHGLDMIAMLQKVGPHNVLRRQPVAVRKQRRGVD